MKNKLLSLLIIAVLLLLSISGMSVSANADTSSPLHIKAQAVTVVINGNPVSFLAYDINGSYYFRLRDLVYSLGGTEKQFDVGWDGLTDSINLTSGKKYEPDGGEASAGGNKLKTTVPTNSKIYLDDVEVMLPGYNIENYNYFTLSSLGICINFAVSFNKTDNMLYIDTTLGRNERIAYKYDIDGDCASDKITFGLAVTEDGNNAYPKLAVEFGDGENCSKLFMLDDIDIFRPGDYALADICGGGQVEFIIELQNMGSFANYRIVILEYDRVSSSFNELFAIYKLYQYDFNFKDNYMFSVSCGETGFMSAEYRFDERVRKTLYYEDGTLRDSENPYVGVDGIYDFKIVETEKGPGIEVYQYVWASAHAGKVGDMISVFVWDDGGLALYSQRFSQSSE